MAFQIPSDLHPDCAPIAWLLATFRGSGHVDYPTMEKQAFGQELIFAHDGRPFFHYLSRSWILDDDGNEVRPAAIETGFMRPQPDNEVEFVLAHSTGFVEVWYGRVEGAKLELTTDAVVRTTSAKEYVAGHRLYGLVEGDLFWTFDMAAMGHPLQSHTWGRLQRV
jgi:THAP4-like, heme-binding beta-barrel domain